MAPHSARAGCAALAAAALLAACSPRPPAPEPIGAIAPFALTDQDGREFGLERLRGSVWVADFFFTSCPSFCPLLTAEMQRLAGEFAAADGVRFLSITVDPETDTPERLRDHAGALGLDASRWSLLTGPRAAIRELCESSFRLAFGDELGPDGDIMHSSRFVLVDRRGRVRGYWDALDPAQQRPLREAIRAVLAERE